MGDTRSRNLREGRLVSGSPPKHQQPYIGLQYGQLTVAGIIYGVRGGIKRVECRCSCGRTTYPHRDNLVAGKSTRCNVCAKAATAATNVQYGFVDEPHRSRLLNRICAIISRCETRPHPRYGGRGIRLHPEWVKDRAAFLRYLITLPGWDNPDLEIDRINNDGHYEPGNLRFVTRSENMQNVGYSAGWFKPKIPSGSPSRS